MKHEFLIMKMWKYFIFPKFLRKLRGINQKKILFPLLLPKYFGMIKYEISLFKLTIGCKTLWILSKKMTKNQNICIFLKFQKLDYLTNETFKERNSIESNFTTKLYRKNTWIYHWKTHILNVSSKNFTGSKSGNIVANVKIFPFS